MWRDCVAVEFVSARPRALPEDKVKTRPVTSHYRPDFAACDLRRAACCRAASSIHVSHPRAHPAVGGRGRHSPPKRRSRRRLSSNQPYKSVAILDWIERSSRGEHRTLECQEISMKRTRAARVNFTSRWKSLWRSRNSVEMSGNPEPEHLRVSQSKILLIVGLGFRAMRGFFLFFILRLAQELELNLSGPAGGLLVGIGNKLAQRSS